MIKDSILFRNSKSSKKIFLLSIVTSIIWTLGRTFNVYKYELVGAIFEMLWFPVIASMLILTILSLIFLIKDKLTFKSLNLYSFLIITMTILFTIYNN